MELPKIDMLDPFLVDIFVVDVMLMMFLFPSLVTLVTSNLLSVPHVPSPRAQLR